MTQIIREAKADIVFANPPTDYNPDHMRASEITFHAVMLAAVRSIKEIEAEPLERTPALFYYDAAAGLEFQPTHYVDITDVVLLSEEWLNDGCMGFGADWCGGADFDWDEEVLFDDFAWFGRDWDKCNDPCDGNCTANW